MVVKNQIKFIRSLQQKKYRIQHKLFVAEGIKLVSELLNSRLSMVWLFTTDPEFTEKWQTGFQEVSEKTLERMSGLKSPNKVLAVFEIPNPAALDFEDWILALDRVTDPGNLGTIIRICDWFGIKHLLCSPGTADCYNPKTLQATMGSIARINIVYQEIESVVKKTDLPVYGAYMNNESVYAIELPPTGILVMGNESHGISDGIGSLIQSGSTTSILCSRLAL